MDLNEAEQNLQNSGSYDKKYEDELKEFKESLETTRQYLKRCALIKKLYRALYWDGLKFATLFNGTQKHLESKSDEELQMIEQQLDSQPETKSEVLKNNFHRLYLIDEILETMFYNGEKVPVLFDIVNHLELKSDEELRTIAHQLNTQTKEETFSKKR